MFNVRYRLTLTGPAKEGEYPNSVLLSRSRFIAPAKHSLRFYREYFKPAAKSEVTKDRLRWQISYRGEEFYVNIDRVTLPVLPGFYIEIKSRTWSRRDAENKAALISELLATLGLQEAAPVSQEYAELTDSGQP